MAHEDIKKAVQEAVAEGVSQGVTQAQGQFVTLGDCAARTKPLKAAVDKACAAADTLEGEVKKWTGKIKTITSNFTTIEKSLGEHISFDKGRNVQKKTGQETLVTWAKVVGVILTAIALIVGAVVYVKDTVHDAVKEANGFTVERTLTDDHD